MMYFTPDAPILQGADPAIWGLIATPRGGIRSWPNGFKCLLDNGCFTGLWAEDSWLDWLDRMVEYQARCVMATAPDVVADAATTLEHFAYYAPILRRRGWRVGLVAQDGLESLSWPADYDALFVGGSTAWKLSDAADWCIKQAKQASKWTHVGRVNGGKRIRHFKLIGVDSVDGTSICFNPPDEFRKLSNGLAYQPLFLLD